MAGFAHLVLLTLLHLSFEVSNFVAAQEDVLHFTSGVSDPAPVPGQPFTLNWAGGDPTAPVYIVLNYLFPNLPNQVIPYGQTDILSNAPNNGSWVYNVPSTIFTGRYTFSIGINPLLLSDSTAPFSVTTSETEYTAPYPSSRTTGSSWSYNGCGLIPLPDYTYTGYQAPCTITSDGQLVTVFPIVPASLSSSFFGSDGVFKTNTRVVSVVPGPGISSASSTSPPDTVVTNTNFASGVYAQALQCSTPVTPAPASVSQDGTTMFFLSAGCSQSSDSDGLRTDEGVCHTSGYATYSVSGTKSVCCPVGWSTTSLLADLFCSTSAQLPASEISAGAIAATDTAYTRAGVVKAAVSPSQTTAGAAESTSTPKPGSASSILPGTMRAWLGPAMAVVLSIAL